MGHHLIDCGNADGNRRLAGRLGPDTVVLADAEAIPADASVVHVPWIGRPWSVAPLARAWRSRRRGRTVQWIDDDAGVGRCGLAFFLREGCRSAWFVCWNLAATIVAMLLLPRRAPPPRPSTDDASGTGPIAIVVPILPDLSHTFVYREIARLCAHEPGLSVHVLEAGDQATVHPEAARLWESAIFVPRDGITAHFWRVIRYFVGSPRRARRLLGLYARSGTPRGFRALLGKLPLRDPRHPARAFALADVLARRPAGPIHVYGSTYAANVALGAAVLLDRPFAISSYVDFDFDYDMKLLREKFEHARFFRVCTDFCGVRMRELLTLPDTTRVPTIVWGLDVTEFRDLEPAVTADPPVLFSASRLVPKKGLHLMPPALAALRDRGIACRWIVAGDGAERERLESLVEEHGVADRVEFLGPIPNDVVRSRLRAATAAVLPCVIATDGERDGIPIFFTEAMALEVPVVATPVSGIPELIEHGVTGYLADEGDVDSLVEALANVLTDDEQRARIAATGRDLVLRTQDADASARTLLARIRDGQSATSLAKRST